MPSGEITELKVKWIDIDTYEFFEQPRVVKTKDVGLKLDLYER